MWRPAAVVGERRFQAVAAVDKHHSQRRVPVPRSWLRTRHYRHHHLFQPRSPYIAAKLPKLSTTASPPSNNSGSWNISPGWCSSLSHGDDRLRTGYCPGAGRRAPGRPSICRSSCRSPAQAPPRRQQARADKVPGPRRRRGSPLILSISTGASGIMGAGSLRAEGQRKLAVCPVACAPGASATWCVIC